MDGHDVEVDLGRLAEAARHGPAAFLEEVQRIAKGDASHTIVSCHGDGSHLDKEDAQCCPCCNPGVFTLKCPLCHPPTKPERLEPEPPELRSVVVEIDGQRLHVLLDNDDGEGLWGSVQDAQGNRIEVYVLDGNPYGGPA